MPSGAALPRPPRRTVAAGALRAAAQRPAIWFLVWGIEALLALAPALLLHSWMNATIAHRYEPGSLVGNLDTIFRFDHREGLDRLRVVPLHSALLRLGEQKSLSRERLRGSRHGIAALAP